MRSEQDTKKWGTIYLGGNKEATLESIDAMQAAARQEQWNQRTQNEYLDRVRERATDRAREILGAAHTERQNLLTEARTEAERIRLETQVQYDKADKALADAEAIRADAQAVRDDAEAIRNAAQEEGFNTGLANARDELDAFRGAMGASIAVVLQSIERQNAAIFAAWREDIVALVQTCVNKGTEWVLQDQHKAVLRALVMESVRQLDNRHTVTLRVHPDDEAAVADMFAAAREAMPDVDRWIVQGDSSVALGGLIAESPSSTVDNRVALRAALVDGILRHLTLPEGEAEVLAAQAIHEVLQEQVAHIESIAPPVPEQYLPPQTETEREPEQVAELGPEQEMEQEPESTPEQGTEQAPAQATEQFTEQAPVQAEMPPSTADAPFPEADLHSPAAHEQSPPLAAAPASERDGAIPPAMQSMPDSASFATAAADPSVATGLAEPSGLADTAVSDIPAGSSAPASPSDLADPSLATPPATDNTAPHAPANAPVQVPSPPTPPASIAAQAAPSLAELEEELLPLPVENSEAVNAVLAGGGFLSDDDSVGSRS